MKALYNIIVHSVQVCFPLLKLISPKLKLFVDGRQSWKTKLRAQLEVEDKVIWFHAASLGEYEQAVPIIDALKQTHSNYKIAVSFFSPSGYEVKKKDSKLDIVTYLPLDTKKNAKAFLDILQPKLAFFIKYEIWPNFMDEIYNRDIKSYLISGLFRKEQLYFRPMGKFMAKALKKFNHRFVQNQESLDLLLAHQFEPSSISGDTRYDRVNAQLKLDNHLDFMASFTSPSQLNVVFGSTWPEDLSVSLACINQLPEDIKVTIAPHQINKTQIQKLKKSISKKVICFSEIEQQDLSTYQVLIVDTVGLLTKIYSYADLAYVGGGMGNSGLHNVLEPAAFGIPVVIGKNYDKFPEAKQLRQLGGLFNVSSAAEFESIFNKLISDKTFRDKSGQICGHFVNSEAGATQKILSHISI